MTTTKYYRKGIKWAKVVGERGAWDVYFGWKSEFRATYHYSMKLKLLATTYAKGWINDQ